MLNSHMFTLQLYVLSALSMLPPPPPLFHLTAGLRAKRAKKGRAATNRSLTYKDIDFWTSDEASCIEDKDFWTSAAVGYIYMEHIDF